MNGQETSQLKEIEKAAKILKKGGVVIFPTDTVYGIGCRFDNPAAVERIRNIKGSRQNFPVLISNLKQAHQLAKINTAALELAQKYWPGGLTIILKKQSGSGKIGIRIPNHKIAISLIDKLGFPIVGTSANFHSQTPPTSVEELDPRIISLVDFVVNGKCKEKTESTVVDATTMPVKSLRSGAIKIHGA
jgi:L-threonylcarbamoyladenylate synthase